jgi:hypothetical protein
VTDRCFLGALCAALMLGAACTIPGMAARQNRLGYVNASRPSVYITDADPPAGEPEERKRDMKWLRLENNCTWTIIVPHRRGVLTDDELFYRVMKLDDIITPQGPTNEAGVSVKGKPLYREAEIVVPPGAGRYWDDSPSRLSIPPGRHITFRVRKAEASRGLAILVPFDYAWEDETMLLTFMEPMHFVRWSLEQTAIKADR